MRGEAPRPPPAPAAPSQPGPPSAPAARPSAPSPSAPGSRPAVAGCGIRPPLWGEEPSGQPAWKGNRAGEGSGRSSPWYGEGLRFTNFTSSCAAAFEPCAAACGHRRYCTAPAKPRPGPGPPRNRGSPSRAAPTRPRPAPAARSVPAWPPLPRAGQPGAPCWRGGMRSVRPEL